MKLAIIELPEDWERGKCEHCIFSDSEHVDCILKMSPSSNHGCGLIVDEGDRDKGPLLKYSRDKISNMLQQHKEDQSHIADKLGRVLRREIRGLTLTKDKDKYKAPRMYNQEEIDACMTKLDCVPDIPEDVLGVPYESKCTCGGTITAIRSPLNGHIGAKCDLCGFLLIE